MSAKLDINLSRAVSLNILSMYLQSPSYHLSYTLTSLLEFFNFIMVIQGLTTASFSVMSILKYLHSSIQFMVCIFNHLFLQNYQQTHIQPSFFCFLGPHLRHVEIPRSRIELELQLLAHTPATATRDLGPTPQLTATLGPQPTK